MKRINNYFIIVVYGLFCWLFTNNLILVLAFVILLLCDMLFYISKKEKEYETKKERTKRYYELCSNYLFDEKKPTIDDDNREIFLENNYEDINLIWHNNFYKKIENRQNDPKKTSKTKLISDIRIAYWDYLINCEKRKEQGIATRKRMKIDVLISLSLMIAIAVSFKTLFTSFNNEIFTLIKLIILIFISGFIHALFIKEINYEEEYFKI